jgi:RNA polymerase sigma-70 factor (ECF subfamily)
VNINDLYNASLQGGKAEEDALFERLRVNLLYLVEQRVGNSFAAEEIVQEALITISGKYRDLNITKSFIAWVHKVMENKILHYYRSKGTLKRKLTHSSEYNEDYGARDQDHNLKRQLLSCLKMIVKTNRRYARILNLSYMGYSTTEICSRLGVSRENGFTLLSRARSMLKYCLRHGEIK